MGDAHIKLVGTTQGSRDYYRGGEGKAARTTRMACTAGRRLPNNGALAELAGPLPPQR